jgi:hypothetical protein
MALGPCTDRARVAAGRHASSTVVSGLDEIAGACAVRVSHADLKAEIVALCRDRRRKHASSSIDIGCHGPSSMRHSACNTGAAPHTQARTRRSSLSRAPWSASRRSAGEVIITNGQGEASGLNRQLTASPSIAAKLKPTGPSSICPVERVAA